MATVIFLDIDGVLNSLGHIAATRFVVNEQNRDSDSLSEDWWVSQIDPTNMAALNHIVMETGAKVVVTSTWRIGHDLEWCQRVLKRAGFIGEVLGMTRHDNQQRGLQIQDWISTHPEIDVHITLDDDLDHHMTHVIKTNPREGGLTWNKAIEAIQLIRSLET